MKRQVNSLLVIVAGRDGNLGWPREESARGAWC